MQGEWATPPLADPIPTAPDGGDYRQLASQIRDLAPSNSVARSAG